jgi:hypothetical protein
MENQIVKINASDYGLDEKRAKEVSAMFTPMLQKMEELEVEANEVFKMPVSQEACMVAKEVRLKYVKVRTGTDAIHKQMKAYFLQGGRYVDGWKNAQLMASLGKEEKLLGIEKHFENIEKQKLEELKTNRQQALLKYEVEVFPAGIEAMSNELWSKYILGVETDYKARKLYAEQIEKERIEKEKAEAEEREKIRIENEKLKAEAEERRKADEIRIKKEIKEKLEREKAESEIKKLQEEKERKIIQEKLKL